MGQMADVANACMDFPDWKDSEHATCAAYSNPHWRFSCTEEVRDKSIFAERRDTSALGLTGLDACCVCGGGVHAARSVGALHLTSVLWPIILGIASQTDNTADGPGANYDKAILDG